MFVSKCGAPSFYLCEPNTLPKIGQILGHPASSATAALASSLEYLHKHHTSALPPASSRLSNETRPSFNDVRPLKPVCRHLPLPSLSSSFSSSSLFASLQLQLLPQNSFLTLRHSLFPTMMRASVSSELIPSQKPSQSRSWRRTVAHALALAQSAVELDSTNADPMGALDAYTKSVRQLRSILARLERHGAQSEASQLAAIVCRRRPPVLLTLLNAFFFWLNGSVILIASGCACCARRVRYRRRLTTTTTAPYQHHVHYRPHPRTTIPGIITQNGREKPCKIEIIYHNPSGKDSSTQGS